VPDPDRVPDPARIVFFGTGAFAVPILERLVGLPGIAVVGVVTVLGRPSGRHGVVRPSAVAEAAVGLGLAVVSPPLLRDASAVAAIASFGSHLGVLADYGRIVPRSILDLPDHGILNVHPSLLPRWRGAAPIPATILAGDRETGVTVIQMDEGLDTGPIVAVERWRLSGRETAPEVELRTAAIAAELIARTIGPWLEGTILARPQEADATMTRPLRREDGRLDPSLPVRDLERRVRALDPWPGTYLETSLGRLIVHRAAVVPGDHADPIAVGTIIAVGAALVLRASDGWLRLDEVQPAGGRRMTAAALLRGRPGFAGLRIE